MNEKYDPARDGGFSESSSEEDSSDESSEYSSQDVVTEAGMENVFGAEVQSEVPMGEISSRIAVVNMDWDNIRAVDLMAVAQSFLPSNGKMLKVSVLPSEFGRERMEREDMEGPAPELFALRDRRKPSQHPASTKPKTKMMRRTSSSAPSSEDDAPSASSSEEDDEAIRDQLLAQSTSSTANAEIDSRALRSYQLSRLRYYYAILTFDSPASASHLYTQMDGREYLTTSNFFDLRFVPDDVSFDDPVTDKPRDECEKVPEGYRPNEFVTEALTHSRVKLTWDEEEDSGRREKQKRAFEGKGDIGTGEMNELLGTSSSEDEQPDQPPESSRNGDTSLSTSLDKAEAARQRVRSLLGLSADTSSKPKPQQKQQPVGDMQITFTSGLAEPSAENPAAGVFTNRPTDVREETTRERYMRKERERKARRKERAKAGRPAEEPRPTTTKDTHDERAGEKDEAAIRQDDPFDDPFFADPAASNATASRAARKENRARAAQDTAAQADLKRRERAELDLLMADAGDADPSHDAKDEGGARHFDMAAVKRAEKESRRKKGRKRRDRGGEDDVGAEGDAGIDVRDPRFESVFVDHEFAIDPTNPRFSGTEGMRRMLEEGRRRRGRGGGEEGEEVTGEKKGSEVQEGKEDGGELDELVQRVKRRKVAT